MGNVERYTDPNADVDPRTSDTGVTSVGASDLDADAANLPPAAPENAVPGVRMGDMDALPSKEDIRDRSRHDIFGGEGEDDGGDDMSETVNS